MAEAKKRKGTALLAVMNENCSSCAGSPICEAHCPVDDCINLVYEELPGWKESTIGITSYDKLPGNARKYLERVQQLVKVPIDMISTGPDREETIVLRHSFG